MWNPHPRQNIVALCKLRRVLLSIRTIETSFLFGTDLIENFGTTIVKNKRRDIRQKDPILATGNTLPTLCTNYSHELLLNLICKASYNLHIVLKQIYGKLRGNTYLK